jgi:hypothetical protein
VVVFCALWIASQGWAAVGLILVGLVLVVELTRTVVHRVRSS